MTNVQLKNQLKNLQLQLRLNHQVLSVVEYLLTLYLIDFKFYDFFLISKGLGEGCDPRKRMHQCNGGLYCYKKSDNPGDGMCVPQCRKGKHISYKKIMLLENTITKKMNRTLVKDDQ